MKSNVWRLALALPFVGVVYAAWELWHSWDALPARMASHFNLAGQANGWMDKSTFPLPLILLPVFLIGLFTVILVFARKQGGVVWILLGLQYWVAGIFTVITHQVIQFNLGNIDRLSVPIVPITAIAVLIVVIGLATHVRGVRKQVPTGDAGLLAEEEHNSGTAAGILLALCAIPVVVAFLAPPSVRVGMGIGIVVLLGCALWAWQGFRYRITTAGVEIRSFGFPLRFVSRDEITQYSAESCNPLTDFGGWGIRGLGRCRAYIWGGRKALHLRTADSELYLGHSDPERMVRELDDMMELVHR